MATRKGKKTSHLTKKECESILFKLENQKTSKYYADVLKQLEKLNCKQSK